MRSIVSVASAALALLFAAPLGAAAQDAAPALPKKPVPYTQLHPKRPAKPRPPATATLKPATVAPAAAAAATATTVAPHPATTAPASPPPVAPAPASQPVPQAPLAPVPTLAPPPTPNARLTPGQALPPGELEAFVDGMIKDAMAREHIAGATVSIVQNGQVVLKKGYGFASLNPRRPVDPDTSLFRVGSISKTFTWIALMKEVEAGRIRLNQPINLYLPEKVQIRDQGFDQPIRVANLMDHSTGFEDRALGQLFERNYDRVRPLDVYLRQERPKRVRAPGVASSYSNYAAALAGEAAAYSAGKPYERLIEDEILSPLGMAHTTFREPHPPKAGLPPPMSEALAADVADGYRWTPTGFERRDYEFIGQIAPAGAASSTAGDMARYMLMQLGGGKLGEATVYGPLAAQAFRTPLRHTPEGINGWAHGFMVQDLPGGHKGYGHGGATLSFMSYMEVVPDLNLGIFISTNTETGRALADRLPVAVVRQFYAAPQVFPRPGSPELRDSADAFRGYYVSTRRAYSGLEGFVTLLRAGAAVKVTADGRLTVPDEGGTRVFVPEGPVAEGRFIAAQGDERLAFTMQDGRARSFVPSSATVLMERAPFWRRPLALGVMAALASVAALATLGGIIARNRREFRQNQIQSRASLLQNIQAVLWLASLALFAIWASKTSDIATIMYGWPGSLLVIASACALVAAALTVITLIALPMLWRGGRRVDSWSGGRKLFFSITVLIYTGFSVLLALWGALSPWGG
jgi:CubicO group peptidase (beta-lactamase class C family)